MSTVPAPEARPSDFGAVAAGAPEQRPLVAWIVRRIGLALVILFCVSVLVFAATVALPGDTAYAILGPDATPARVRVLRAQLGLDDPLVEQYGRWIGGVLTGDLGTSLANREPVWDLIGHRLLNSALLVALTGLLVIPLAFGLGVLSAARRDGALDNALLAAALGLVALPEFVIGFVLVILFGTTVWKVLPAVALIPPGDSPLSHLEALVLPVASLVLTVFPYLFRLIRASTIDALQSEYVRMARLKGMPERLVLLRHAMPNALVPGIQGAALSLAYLTGGIVVIEFLFGYPGLGRALTDAVSNRDVPVIQAVVLIFSTAYLTFTLIADVLTVMLTPRLRTRH